MKKGTNRKKSFCSDKIIEEKKTSSNKAFKKINEQCDLKHQTKTSLGPNSENILNDKPEQNANTCINLITPLHKNMVLAKVGNTKTQALVDTGASISIVSKSFLKKANLNFDSLKPPILNEVSGVGGERIGVLEKLKCR